MVLSGALSKILAFAIAESPRLCLDIGCGTGQLTRELYHRGYTCVGIDASSKAIEMAKAATIVEGLSYLHLDIEQDGLAAVPHAPYGLITCKLVYAFIKDKPRFLKQVQEVLSPAGIFVVITPLADDVPPEQQGIAVTAEDMQLLGKYFKQVARYKEFGLEYFVGQR